MSVLHLLKAMPQTQCFLALLSTPYPGQASANKETRTQLETLTLFSLCQGTMIPKHSTKIVHIKDSVSPPHILRERWSQITSAQDPVDRPGKEQQRHQLLFKTRLLILLTSNRRSSLARFTIYQQQANCNSDSTFSHPFITLGCASSKRRSTYVATSWSRA